MSFPFAGLYSDDLRSAANRLLPNIPVTVNVHGTSTPAVLYTSRSKGATAPNPTVTDSVGNLLFYADPGLYDVTSDGEGFVTVAVVPDSADLGGGGGSTANAVIDLPQFDVTQFGAVADNTTNCKAAFIAAASALFASGAPGVIWVPPSPIPYRVILAPGDVTHGAGDQYANIPIPLRVHDASTPTITWGLASGLGPSVVGRQFPGTGNLTPQGLGGGAIIRLDYSTPFTYSGSFGWPSWIGAPDLDHSSHGSTNVHWYQRGITIRQPVNPSLCGVNLELAQCLTADEIYFDVNAGLDDPTEPTNLTGVGMLMPNGGNAAVLSIGKIGSVQHFGGVQMAEHLDIKYVYSVKNKIGLFVRRGADHDCHISQTVIEECPFGIAGYDPSVSTGIVAVPGGFVMAIDSLDFEDFATGTGNWTDVRTKGSHVYDPNNQLIGIVQYMCINSTATAPVGRTDNLIGKGGTGVGFQSLLQKGTNVNINQTGHDPVAPGSTVPQAPTIGVATPGAASATVAFTANGNGGAAITGFTATSTPGGLTGTGASSPVTVNGLTPGTPYTFTVHATNINGNSPESAASNSVTPTAPSGVSIFATPTPTSPDLNDSQRYSLGTRFTISANGHNVTNIRWRFPTTLPSGAVVGELWHKTGDVAGTLLGTVAFTAPVAGQWNTSAAFGSPIAIVTGQEYVAVINTPDHYVVSSGFFTGHSEVNGILTSAADDTVTPDRNGILFIGAAGNYPNQAGGGGCYFADVVVS